MKRGVEKCLFILPEIEVVKDATSLLKADRSTGRTERQSLCYRYPFCYLGEPLVQFRSTEEKDKKMEQGGGGA